MVTAIINKKTITHRNEDFRRSIKYLKACELLSDLPKYSESSSITTQSTSGLSSKDENKKEQAKVKSEKRKWERPDGRKTEKEEHAAQNLRAKNIKLSGTVIQLKEQHKAELMKKNEILQFSNGPGGADLGIAKRYFVLKQTAVLKELEESMKKQADKDDTNLTVLLDAIQSVDE